MLDNAFLKNLGIREELLPQGYRSSKNDSLGESPEEEPFVGPFSKPIEVHRNDLNRMVWDEDYGSISHYEYGDGLILLVCPEEVTVDPLVIMSMDDFEKFIDALPQPIKKITGCRDRHGYCWYYVPPGFTDLECLGKLNLQPKH